MKAGTLVLIVAAAGAAYYFEQLGVAGQTIQINFAGVTFKSITKLSLLFNIQNVSNAPVFVKALTADVTVNGDSIGSISAFPTGTEGNIPATGQKQMAFDLDISIISLPGAVRDIINNSSGQLNFEVIGNANVNSLVLPFDLTKTVSV